MGRVLRAGAAASSRGGCQEQLGVGVEWLAEKVVGGRLLDDLPRVHHRHPVHHAANDLEVVADEEQRQAEVLDQTVEEAEDLHPGDGVECRGGLVGDQKTRIARKGESQHDPLRLAPRKLVGIGIEDPVNGVNGHHFEEIARHIPAARSLGAAVATNGLLELKTGRIDGVECARCFLKTETDTSAAPSLEVGGRDRRKVSTFDQDGTADDPPGFGDHPETGERGEALAASGLADNGHAFTLRQRQ